MCGGDRDASLLVDFAEGFLHHAGHSWKLLWHKDAGGDRGSGQDYRDPSSGPQHGQGSLGALRRYVWPSQVDRSL